MKNITQTKVITSNSKQGRRNCGWRKGVIFVESASTELLDQWFNSNNISDLDYRCATWNWLIRKHTEVIAKAIRKHFLVGDEVKISWNAYAGCSCPCSKGYVITSETNDTLYPHFNEWVWMDVLLDATDLHELENFISLAGDRLKKEKHRRANPPAVPTIDYREE